MSSLDEIDFKIIDILKKDARTPFTEIASILGVSDSTIHVRLKKLKEDGVLKGFTVELNEELLGKRVHGLAMINVNLGYLEKVVSKLLNKMNIVKIYETHGINDLIVQIDASDLEDLRQIIMDIRKIENIASTSLITVLKIWK